MKKYFILVGILTLVLFVSGCGLNNPAVKKSDTGICHQKGTSYYEKTKNFTSYNFMDECLKSGGRLPKK